MDWEVGKRFSEDVVWVAIEGWVHINQIIGGRVRSVKGKVNDVTIALSQNNPGLFKEINERPAQLEYRGKVQSSL